MAEPLLKPREDSKPLLEEFDLRNPPQPQRATDSDGLEEWDDDAECDEYFTEDEVEDEEGDAEDEEEEGGEEEEEEIKEEIKEDETKVEETDVKVKDIEKIEEAKENTILLDKNEKGEIADEDIKKLDSKDDDQYSDYSKYNEENETEKQKYTDHELKTPKETSGVELTPETTKRKQFQRYERELYEYNFENPSKYDKRSSKVKERLKRHLRPVEDPVTSHEFTFRPGIPFKEQARFSPSPRRRTKENPQIAEKPVIDVDADSEMEAEEDVGHPYPEELEPVPEIGSDKWKALMEGIMYQNPYEGYVPEETKEPMEAILDRMDRLDYQEGRYFDEDEIDGPFTTPGKVTLKDVERVLEKLVRDFEPKRGGMDRRWT